MRTCGLVMCLTDGAAGIQEGSVSTVTLLGQSKLPMTPSRSEQGSALRTPWIPGILMIIVQFKRRWCDASGSGLPSASEGDVRDVATDVLHLLRSE